jgi:ankyrin repeat protein
MTVPFKGATTALMHSAERANQHVVEYLISMGLKVDAVDTYGQTPLMWAAAANYAEHPDELIQKKISSN